MVHLPARYVSVSKAVSDKRFKNHSHIKKNSKNFVSEPTIDDTKKTKTTSVTDAGYSTASVAKTVSENVMNEIIENVMSERNLMKSDSELPLNNHDKFVIGEEFILGGKTGENTDNLTDNLNSNNDILPIQTSLSPLLSPNFQTSPITSAKTGRESQRRGSKDVLGKESSTVPKSTVSLQNLYNSVNNLEPSKIGKDQEYGDDIGSQTMNTSADLLNVDMAPSFYYEARIGLKGLGER